MSTATITMPATRATAGTSLQAAMSAAWQQLFGATPDPMEQYLGKARNHDDLAIRRRACAEHEARARAMSQVF